MITGEGWIEEIYRDQGGAGGRIRCEARLRPAPGQYLMADASEAGKTPSSLAVALFTAGRWEEGFDFAGPVPEGWQPGTRLSLRGPLGHGFQIPRETRRAALVAFEGPPARLRALIPELLRQEAAVTLVGTPPFPELPEAIEVQPPEALGEVVRWADYLAMDVSRDSLPKLRERLGRGVHITAEVLVRAPMPCGAMAECGVCAVHHRRGWKLACKDGPVFDWKVVGEE